MFVLFWTATAQAMEPTCILTWEELQAGGRASPLGGAVQASSALAVVDDGDGVRPLTGLPTACALGPDGPGSGTVVDDQVVTLDRATPAVTWTRFDGSTWTEAERFEGPFPHQGLPEFGVGFLAGADTLAIVSDEETGSGTARHVDVSGRDGSGGWAEQHSFLLDIPYRSFGGWIRGDHMRVPSGSYTVWTDAGGAWTETVPSVPAERPGDWLEDSSDFDGTTLVTVLGDITYQTGRIAVHRWDDTAGWDDEAVLTSVPTVSGAWQGYQGMMAVNGNVVAAMWVMEPYADTGSPVGEYNEVHVWRRGLAGWSLVDTFASPRSGDGFGLVAMQGHTLLVGSREPGVERSDAIGAAHGAFYVFDIPVVDADGDGEDELTDPDDLDPNVQSDDETDETGDTGTGTDTATTTTTDTGTATDTGATTDTGAATDKDGGCGCDAAGAAAGGPVLALLALAIRSSRRRHHPRAA